MTNTKHFGQKASDCPKREALHTYMSRISVLVQAREILLRTYCTQTTQKEPQEEDKYDSFFLTASVDGVDFFFSI